MCFGVGGLGLVDRDLFSWVWHWSWFVLEGLGWWGRVGQWSFVPSDLGLVGWSWSVVGCA